MLCIPVILLMIHILWVVCLSYIAEVLKFFFRFLLYLSVIFPRFLFRVRHYAFGHFE